MFKCLNVYMFKCKMNSRILSSHSAHYYILPPIDWREAICLHFAKLISSPISPFFLFTNKGKFILDQLSLDLLGNKTMYLIHIYRSVFAFASVSVFTSSFCLTVEKSLANPPDTVGDCCWSLIISLLTAANLTMNDHNHCNHASLQAQDLRTHLKTRSQGNPLDTVTGL